METHKVCFITAIFGNYETTCKPFVQQSIPTDFICFTDSEDITANGWEIDRTPYHFTHPSSLDTQNTRNSLKHNKHSFNIAKYYKQAFINIPRLQNYDIVVWLDGTIQITNPKTSEWLLQKEESIIGWNHECLDRSMTGSYLIEAMASSSDKRYVCKFWNNQTQPIQPCMLQAGLYEKEGFLPDFFRTVKPDNPLYGLWVTCFVSFRQKNPEVQRFLNIWYEQTLKHTTQDQIGFPYAAWKSGIYPYTLPDSEIKGERPHIQTDFYYKVQSHGK